MILRRGIYGFVGCVAIGRRCRSWNTAIPLGLMGDDGGEGEEPWRKGFALRLKKRRRILGQSRWGIIRRGHDRYGGRRRGHVAAVRVLLLRHGISFLTL
jgi:hypothetical protein